MPKRIGRPQTLEGQRSSGRETRAPKPRGFQSLEAVPPRVYAPDTATAKHYGGPDAVALKRVTLGVEVELWERVKNAAHALPGLDNIVLVDAALRDTCSQLEADYNNGQPFPKKPSKVKRGPNIIRAKL